MSNHLEYVVQSEFYAGGVIESQVVAALRARATLPHHPPTALTFLESRRVVRQPDASEMLSRYRAMWPAGRISLLSFASRWERSPSVALALSLASRVVAGRFRGRGLILHARGPVAALTAHRARRLLGGGRMVFDIRGHGPDEAVARLLRQRPEASASETAVVYERALELERRAASCADSVVAVSPSLCSYATVDLGVPPDRVGEVPNGLERVTFDVDARLHWRQRFGIAPDAPVMAYSGRLGPERRPDLIASTFAALARRRPDAHLLLLVYLDDGSDIERRLVDSGVDLRSVTRVQLPHDEAISALSCADVGLMFLAEEDRFRHAAPIKYAEYLAAGLAVVVTPGSLSASVVDNDVGWVLDERVPGSVESVIDAIIGRPSQARSRSLALCDDRYTWAASAPTLLRAYGIDVHSSRQGVDERAG